MGDYAASGGYYISCGADKIFAQPVTLTGSIGIFGMIPNAHRLLSDKLGINTGTVKTNANGNFPSIMDPMTPAEASAMQAYVERGYDLFTKRCAEGRQISQDSIKKIGEGRVWDGREALRIGLVDEPERKDVFGIELPEEIKSAMSEIDITPAVLSHGNKLMQLTLPDHTLAVMVKRDGHYFIPKGNTELKENDKLLMISDNDEALLQAYDSLGVKDYTMKKN